MDLYQKLSLAGVALGSSWPLYQLVKHLTGPSLVVRLTKNFFFRLNNYGECVFLNPVVMAERGNITIEDVKATLMKTDGAAQKSWEIEFVQFGERVRNQNDVVSNHFFHSTSPLSFVTADKPIRAVYMGRVKEYSESYVAVLKNLYARQAELKQKVPINPTDSDKDEMTKINDELVEASKYFFGELKELIQLEAGEYRLKLEIKYSKSRALFKKLKKTSSAISFAIAQNARNTFQASLPLALYTEGFNYVFNKSSIVTYPEYSPINIKEE